MKPKLWCSYLYADGHAVLVYEKSDKHAGTVKWCEVHEKFGPECQFEGRIVIGSFSEGLTNLCKRAAVVRAKEPDAKHGSDATKKLGISIGTMEVQMSSGSYHDSLYFYDMPGTFSGPYHYQPETIEVFKADATHWSDYRIAKIHRAKQPQTV